MSVTHKFSCWIRETRFEALLCLKLWWVQAGSGSDLTNSEKFPLDSRPSTNLQFATQTLLSCQMTAALTGPWEREGLC